MLLQGNNLIFILHVFHGLHYGAVKATLGTYIGSLDMNIW